MARKLSIYNVFYRFHSTGIVQDRYCLARNPHHAVTVLQSSLYNEGKDTLSYDIVYPIIAIKTYR